MGRLQRNGQNCGLVSRNRPVCTGVYKGFSVSFLVLDGKKVLFVQAYLETEVCRLMLKHQFLPKFLPSTNWKYQSHF